MPKSPLIRHGGILRWLTVLVLVSGTLSWMPALAGNVAPVTTGIASVAIACPTASATVPGTLTVTDPADGVVVNVDLLAGDTSVDSESVTLTAGSTTYNLEFALESGDLDFGQSIKAVATFAGGGGSTTSTSRSIGEYQGAVVCVPDGGLPVVPTTVPPTQVPSPTPSPSPSPTTVPTQVPGSSPTPVPTTVPGQSPTPTSPTTGKGTVVNTNGANLNCRNAPVSGSVIVKLAPGSTVTVTGATSNGWVPVTCGGQAGWVSAAYLSVSAGGTGTTPTPTTVPTTGFVTVTGTNGDNLRCRTAPVNGATIVLMPPGSRLQVRGAAQNGWTPITCSGQSGWASSTYLTADTGTPPTSTPDGSGGGTGKYVTVDGTGGAGLRCRTAPSTGAVITVLADGTRVQTRGANSGGWIPVICGGQNGYVSASYVMVEIPAGSGELWFDVNLSSQYMRVYRGNTVIMQTYVSTGKNGFETPTGTFYINRKLVTRTMTGVLGGEYYNVPNVPWVMYFTNVGHAIHGAYWHNAFGTRRSHGCINLPVPFSEQLYHITPIGTRVRIHY